MEKTEQSSVSIIYIKEYKKQNFEEIRQNLIEFVNGLTPSEKPITAGNYLEQLLTLILKFNEHLPKKANFPKSLIEDIYCFLGKDAEFNQEIWTILEKTLIGLLQQSKRLQNLIKVRIPPCQTIYDEIIRGLADMKLIKTFETLDKEYMIKRRLKIEEEYRKDWYPNRE